jgi:hypothetical protein
VSDENRLELFRALRDTQEKYVYFLLAAAGAAIGFALSQTQQATLSWSKLPLAGAVFLAEARAEAHQRSGRPGRSAAMQYWFLVTGASFYVMWHVWEMYLRTFHGAT